MAFQSSFTGINNYLLYITFSFRSTQVTLSTIKATIATPKGSLAIYFKERTNREFIVEKRFIATSSFVKEIFRLDITYKIKVWQLCYRLQFI